MIIDNFSNSRLVTERGVFAAALFSPCKRYRYILEHRWGSLYKTVAFVGLNPSTATHEQSDPTVTRCINYAKAWGFGGMLMLNLFAYRATDPKDMKRHHAPIGGPDTNDTLERCSRMCELTVAAWGTHGTYMGRDREVLPLLTDPHALRLTKKGLPWHPLYLPRGLDPFPYPNPYADD